MKIIKYTFFMIFFFVIFLGGSLAMGQFFFFQHPMQDQMAPDFVLKTLKGQTLRMSEYRDGQKAILFFWATWCPHCRMQLKQLYDERNNIAKQGIKVILVDLEEDARQVGVYLEKRHIDFEVFLDENADVGEQYQIIGIPSFFFLNSQGKIVAVKNFLPENFEQIFKDRKDGFTFGETPKQPLE